MRHYCGMTDAPGPRSLILVLGGEETARVLEASVTELEVVIERLDDCELIRQGGPQDRADLVVVDVTCAESPATLAGWTESDVFDPSVPLLLFAPRPVDSEAYRSWLAAGVWEVVRLPVDPAMLALRLRNMIGGRRPPSGRPPIAPHHPYPWPSLVRATGEVLALARRYDRPVACAAIAIEPGGDPEAPGAPRMMNRLAVTAQDWVRNSDLVGISEHDIIVVVLPDTEHHEAEGLLPRLQAALERSLRLAGTVVRLRAAVHAADWTDDPSAVDFLLATVRKVS
jgi:hypothetical protein